MSKSIKDTIITLLSVVTGVDKEKIFEFIESEMSVEDDPYGNEAIEWLETASGHINIFLRTLRSNPNHPVSDETRDRVIRLAQFANNKIQYLSHIDDLRGNTEKLPFALAMSHLISFSQLVDRSHRGEQITSNMCSDARLTVDKIREVIEQMKKPPPPQRQEPA